MKKQKQLFNFKSSYQAMVLIQQILPNPDIVLKRRGQGITIYRELLSDAHLSAVLGSRSAVPKGYDWGLDRNGCPENVFKSIENWFFNILERKSGVDDLSREELIDNLMDVIYWGYQPAELTWGFEEGLFVPIQIVPKPPEWFFWWIGATGVPELRFLSEAHSIEGEPPPDAYTLICPRVKPSYENPYGQGVASKCFWPVLFKRAGLEFWINFMERFAQPWVIGKTNSADATQVANLAADLKVLVQDAVIALSGTDKTVELLETHVNKDAGFDVLCNFMDSQMSKAVLGHTLSTDAGDKGSYAATRGALSVRGDIGVQDTKMIKAIFNDVIHLIMLRNGYVKEPRPSLRPYHENQVDVERAQRDEAAGRVGVRFKKSYFIRMYGYQEDDIEDIDPDPLGKQVTGSVKEKETSTTPGGLKGGGSDKSGKQEKT
jgi:phage gp29-like protein